VPFRVATIKIEIPDDQAEALASDAEL